METIGAGYDDKNQILNALRLGVQFRFNVTLRGLTIPLRPLSMEETILINQRIQEQLLRTPIMATDNYYISALRAKETLQLASTSRPGETDFRITPHELNQWTGDEVNALFREYVSVTDKVNPDVDVMSVEEMEFVIDVIKKKPEAERASALTELSFSQLKAIICFLVRSN